MIHFLLKQFIFLLLFIRFVHASCNSETISAPTTPATQSYQITASNTAATQTPTAFILSDPSCTSITYAFDWVTAGPTYTPFASTNAAATWHPNSSAITFKVQTTDGNDSGTFTYRLCATYSYTSTTKCYQSTLTIVRDCSLATVIAPGAIVDVPYAINLAAKTFSFPAFSSSDANCVSDF